LIVIAELMGTSLWFSINGVADNLIDSWNINLAGIGILTNAVQLGFVAGTLVFASKLGLPIGLSPAIFLLYVPCLGPCLMPHLLYWRIVFGPGLACASWLEFVWPVFIPLV
jgi:hypothetical protein